ncbi:exodeoxyribonuclease III [Lujinxingia vulgaris]|uniref:Exodeoxyribonuclease III n=1 Tax=Lujinxingia vulgaris TaxID=2600176 RepID=A0A5C6XDH3_9DELT|nr:exodeoxyribonuclease III [Lujinxingia vulgaris]TXD36842.1 exodeoxyribonuclease III [Lujinxingia vulgaris]
MKIYSWNVNGLRACVRKGFLDWLDGSEADVVGLQEVRALPEQLTRASREPEGWHTYFNPAERKGYSGVGIYSRMPFDAVENSVEVEAFDVEGRVQIAQLGALKVLNVYFPNGSGRNRDLSRIPYKLDFYAHLREMLAEGLASGERILVMGDFNTAHRAIDLARPKSNEATSGFRPEEREELDRWLDAGWVDTFRAVHGDVEERYTWWSQRGDVRARNVGWRIDYIYASPGAMEFVVDARIHDQVMGSDHCPISVTLDGAILEG